jgi:hypothetical protein
MHLHNVDASQSARHLICLLDASKENARTAPTGDFWRLAVNQQV